VSPVASARPAAAPPPSLPPRAGAVIYSNLHLTAEERELLEMTPEAAVAKGDAAGAATAHLARCAELLAGEPDEVCHRIDGSMHALRFANATLMREFLSGTVEVSRFQEQYHRNMVGFQVALEAYLSFDQLMRYAQVEPGDDPFLVLTNWGVALPPGYTLGEDIISRGEGDGADPARDPWTWGQQHLPAPR
jgi:hypothetical protein